MGTKPMIWIGMTVGSVVGGFIPLLWGGDSFSFSGIFWNAVGAIVGIYAGYKLSNW